MAVRGAQTRITKEVTSWAGVASQPHPRFGGVEYVIGKREIGTCMATIWWIFRSLKGAR